MTKIKIKHSSLSSATKQITFPEPHICYKDNQLYDRYFVLTRSNEDLDKIFQGNCLEIKKEGFM